MEEKKTNELTDETLDAVSGGYDGPHAEVGKCPFCDRSIPMVSTGDYNVVCGRCNLRLYFRDGFCIGRDLL